MCICGKDFPPTVSLWVSASHIYQVFINSCQFYKTYVGRENSGAIVTK